MNLALGHEIGGEMAKVNKAKFDALLTKLLTAKPEPRQKIKSSGKYGPKTPIFAKP